MNVIVNTTVVSNFASIGETEMLRHLFGEIYIALEVYEEIMLGLNEGYQFYQSLADSFAPLSPNGWIHITALSSDEEIKTFGAFPVRLHKGEAASMSIAHHRNWMFLTDDRAAREVSRQYDIPISGSIGCLVAGVERGYVSQQQANLWLKQLIDQGFRSPVSDLRELL